VSWSHLPPPARAIAVTATDAVRAAGGRDLAGYQTAVAVLAGTDGSGLVLGSVARLLLEELHPDGLDGEDVRVVLENCVRSAGEWLPSVDPHVVLVLLVNALGVYAGDDAPEPDPKDVAWHGPLLVADLLAGASRGLDWYLRAAFLEVQRGELHD
jgi:hypothetical protein